MLIVARINRTLICSLLLCLLVPIPVSCGAENLKVLVALSDNSAPYLSFANELHKNLPAWMQATVLEHPGQLSTDVPQTDLIVAVGMKATELAAEQSGIPVLAVMIPRTAYEALLAQASPKKAARSISVIYLDQPWSRRIDFWRAALPERRRIGLLHAPDTHIDIARLRQDIAQRGGSLVAQPVFSEDELFPRLENVLAGSDVLFAIPDSMIYSSSNIRNILLTSYRHSVPLIGLSQAYVNAGALCAIFSTPEQLAVQTSAAVISFARDRRLPEPQYSVDFTIAVNQQVARSLGIELSSPEAIRNRMDKAKEGVH
jgi:putative tryptophan/tyrosine transport system substrate-binding protein